MSEDKSNQRKQEEILMALDQVSQTIEVMSKVVNRLRNHISAYPATNQEPKLEKPKPVARDLTLNSKEKVLH